MSRLAWRIFVTIFLTLLATGLGAIAITSWYIEQRATRSAMELTVGAETAAEALAAGGRLGLTYWARQQAADQNSLLIASESALEVFDILTGRTDRIVALEADNPKTRSNDGRADPWGGFWIGTMAKDHEKHAGAIYRYYRGELRKLLPNISISNAICFIWSAEKLQF